MEGILKRILYLALLIIIFGACDSRIKTSHEILFDHIFFKIKLNSIKRNEVNWTDLEKKVKDSVKVFASRADMEKAIKLTLKLIDDNHSKFIESGSNNPFLDKKLALPKVEARIIVNNIGYIKIPGFAANDSISRLYSIKIRDALSLLDKQGELSGWIIDVRGNNGGRIFMFPLGISPLLKDSVIIRNRNNRGKEYIDLCTGNLYFEGKHSIISIPPCDNFVNKDKPVAVLMDSTTASGGELTVVLLKNIKTTRSFGLKTRGATSSLTSWDIINKKDSYHSQILLAVNNWYDKNNNLIHGKLTPDVECDPQECLNLAIRWIGKDNPMATLDNIGNMNDDSKIKWNN